MELKQAREIVKTLADGIHPVTGEILPAEDSCNQPEVIRALHTVVDAISGDGESISRKPEKAGRKWTPVDDKYLCQLFDEGCSATELCRIFQRTHKGIAARLVRLGKIEERKDWKE